MSLLEIITEYLKEYWSPHYPVAVYSQNLISHITSAKQLMANFLLFQFLYVDFSDQFDSFQKFCWVVPSKITLDLHS